MGTVEVKSSLGVYHTDEQFNVPIHENTFMPKHGLSFFDYLFAVTISGIITINLMLLFFYVWGLVNG